MNTAAQIAGSARADEWHEAPGLREMWALHSRREPPPRTRQTWMADRILLDALGLGLEQTLRHLGNEAPDYAEFLQWIVDVTGGPDPVALARYRNWRAGEPAPDEVRRKLAEVDAAAPVLDEADLRHWDDEGFVVLRQAITADESRAAAEALWTHLGARADAPSTWYGPRTNGIMIQLFQHPAQEAARRSARVHKAFAQLWGDADLWMTTDRMSFNPPERPGRPFTGPHLHWDASLARPISFATQGILYLTDTAANQGAFSLLPGFHRRIDDWLDSLAPDSDPRTEILRTPPVPIPAGAGDLIIWRNDLPHGATPNTSDRPRLAQYLNMYSPRMTQNPVWF